MAAVAHARISHFETTRLLSGALEDIAATLRSPEKRSAFASAEPFPHLVLDGLFPAEVVDALAVGIPERGNNCHGPGVTCFNRNGFEKGKVQTTALQAMGPHARAYMEFVRSAAFRRALEGLTGFGGEELGLVNDEHNEGAGIQTTGPGGYLKVHADFNGDFGRGGPARRLNTFLYLNPDWDDAYQGHLQLWSRNMSQCAREISPILGRFVVFKTTDFTYHGHPVPLNAPEGRVRRSIAAYFYTEGNWRRDARECLRPNCPSGDHTRCSCPWHNTLWKDAKCALCLHHTMHKPTIKADGRGACGVGMLRKRKHVVQPHQFGHGPMHEALARFHGEHVSN